MTFSPLIGLVFLRGTVVVHRPGSLCSSFYCCDGFYCQRCDNGLPKWHHRVSACVCFITTVQSACYITLNVAQDSTRGLWVKGKFSAVVRR